MAQIATSSRLTNSAINIIGATTANNTNYGLTSIGVTGNNFDISALSTGNNITIGANGTRNVTIGSAASGTVTFPGLTSFTQPVSGGSFSGTTFNGTAVSSAMTIGSNLTTGSVTIGAQSANTVTIGANSVGATGTVNVGTGSANINIGSTAASTVNIGGGTVAFSGTTTVTILNATSATSGFNLGNNSTSGSVSIANGSSFTGNIGIGAGNVSRTGTINIGSGGSGNITIGNTTCNTNLYNVYLDGATQRMPRLLLKNTKVLTIVGGSSNNLLETFTSPTGNNFDLIINIINGDIGVQNSMTVSAAVNSTQIFASVTNGTAGVARFSYSIFSP
jgi:hypothetical protein